MPIIEGPDYRARLWVQARGWCGICWLPVPWPVGCSTLWLDTAQADHIIPISRGGTNDEHNLQLAHAACNSRKGASLDWPNRHAPDFPGHFEWSREDGEMLAQEWREALEERMRELAESMRIFFETKPWTDQLTVLRYAMTDEELEEEAAWIDEVTGGVTF